MNPFIGGFFDELIKTGGVFQKIRRLRQIAQPGTPAMAKLQRLESRYAGSVERRMRKPGGFPGDKAELKWHTRNEIAPYATQAEQLSGAARVRNRQRVGSIAGGKKDPKTISSYRSGSESADKQGIFEAQLEAAKRAKKNERTGVAKLLNFFSAPA